MMRSGKVPVRPTMELFDLYPPPPLVGHLSTPTPNSKHNTFLGVNNDPHDNPRVKKLSVTIQPMLKDVRNRGCV
jgi:hypothetical protein